MHKPTPWQRGTKVRRYDPPCLPHDDVIDHDEKEDDANAMSAWRHGTRGRVDVSAGPPPGRRRRDRVRGYVEDYGRQTGAFVDNTGRGLRRQAQAVFATARRAVPPPAGAWRTAPHTSRAAGAPTGMVLVGCVGLGVGLGYLWARQGPSSVPGGARKPTLPGVPRSAAMPTSGSSPGAGTFSKAVTRTAWMRIPASRPKPRPGMRSQGVRESCAL